MGPSSAISPSEAGRERRTRKRRKPQRGSEGVQAAGDSPTGVVAELANAYVGLADEVDDAGAGRGEGGAELGCADGEPTCSAQERSGGTEASDEDSQPVKAESLRTPATLTEKPLQQSAKGENDAEGAKGAKGAKGAARKHKTGVCYLSRIPPHMKPLKLRHLLSSFAAVGRIYLAPEDPSVRQRRKQAGGNTGKNFTEGWVEFERKRDAKRVAELLNGEPMGGGHRSAYRWDLWNIKYLSGFKWDNLTEEIAYRNSVREQKLATELRAAAKERDFYLQQVNKSKGLKAMEQKRMKRERAQAEAEGLGEGGAQGGERGTEGRNVTEDEDKVCQGRSEDKTGGGKESSSFKRVRRAFVQRGSVAEPGAAATPLLSKDVLGKIFG